MSLNDWHTSSEGTISRRRTLQALGTGALTIGGVSGGVLANNGASDDTVVITVVEGSDGARIQKEVPADWYYYEEHVDDVAKQFREAHRDTPAVKAVGIGSGAKVVAGRNAGNLRVYLDQTQPVPDLPSSFKNVPVRTTAYHQAIRRSCNCNKNDYSIMPGAVTVESDSDGLPAGTATCEVERGGNLYMMTASHIFTCQNADITGDKAWQSGQEFGTIADYDHNGDWCLIDRYQNGPVTDYDNEIEDYAGILSGHVTYDGLKDHMGSSYDPTLRHGVTTCKHSGKIIDRSFSTSFEGCNPQTVSEWVLTNNDNEPGDSGGPVFDQYTYNGCYYIAVIGLLSGGQNPTTAECSDSASSEGIVSPAWKMNNNHNINFDPEFEFGYCK